MEKNMEKNVEKQMETVDNKGVSVSRDNFNWV